MHNRPPSHGWLSPDVATIWEHNVASKCSMSKLAMAVYSKPPWSSSISEVGDLLQDYMVRYASKKTFRSYVTDFRNFISFSIFRSPRYISVNQYGCFIQVRPTTDSPLEAEGIPQFWSSENVEERTNIYNSTDHPTFLQSLLWYWQHWMTTGIRKANPTQR